MPKKSAPSYLHYASGQAFSRVNGKNVYFGLHGSPESLARYDDFKRELAPSARRRPQVPAHRGRVGPALLRPRRALLPQERRPRFRGVVCVGRPSASWSSDMALVEYASSAQPS